MPAIIAIILISAFVGILVFGSLAALHIDPKKKEEATGHIYTWGPLVSECILTEKGQKLVFIRNISALLFAGGGVIYGIVMRIIQG